MRLIDADKLPLDIMPEDVDNAPTIDAVPVVRRPVPPAGGGQAVPGLVANG